MATDLLAELTAAENRVWQALVAGDATADGAALDDSFLGVYPSGFSDKAGHIGQLAEGPVMEHFRLSELRLMRLGGLDPHDIAPQDLEPDEKRASCEGPGDSGPPGPGAATELALLAYRADFRRKGAIRDEAYYVSSIWRRQGGAWINLFSQDTPVAGIAG